MAKKGVFGHVEDALAYARAVAAGRIPAGKHVRQACKRQLDELKRWPPSAKASGGKPGTGKYYFDELAAEKVCRFVENLPHIKGEWANRHESIRLEPWQKFILTTIFGWKRSDGKRRFRTAYVEVPRKNGKSILASAIGLYMLTEDGEAGSEVYSAAVTRSQARIIFDVAKAMIRKEREFREYYGVEALKDVITVLETASKFVPLSREAGAEEGSSVHCGLVDELHRHKTREIYDILKTGTGARSQPLIFIITTAGFDQSGVCYTERRYVTRVLAGEFEDETYFGVIYQIDEDDDWKLEENWKKANPNYGISVDPEQIKAGFLKALNSPQEQTTFLTKHLNRWVNASVGWMNMERWRQCGTRLNIEEFISEDCWIHVDLASRVDIASVAILFKREEQFYFFSRNYLPEERVHFAGSAATAHYEAWAREGWIKLTPGNMIDITMIEEDLYEDMKKFNVREIAFDPWNAAQIMANMQQYEAPVVELKPCVANYSAPMKHIEALTLEGNIIHEGSPVVNWAMSNVVCRVDANDNIYPRKDEGNKKIDPIVAVIGAMNRAMAEEGDGDSVYDEGGIFAV